MNESSQACCEYYQSRQWMNALLCKAQLLFSCLTACLSSSLSTCLPDYLPTYRASFVQIKGAWMGGRGEILFLLTRIHLETETACLLAIFRPVSFPKCLLLSPKTLNSFTANLHSWICSVRKVMIFANCLIPIYNAHADSTLSVILAAQLKD